MTGFPQVQIKHNGNVYLLYLSIYNMHGIQFIPIYNIHNVQ